MYIKIFSARLKEKLDNGILKRFQNFSGNGTSLTNPIVLADMFGTNEQRLFARFQLNF